MRFTGLTQNFDIEPAKHVGNAFATIVNKRRAILYNPEFMKQAVAEGEGSNWVAITILAHEIAHHLNNHFLLLGAGSRKKLEIEADEFAGFVLYKMGAELETSTVSFAISTR